MKYLVYYGSMTRAILALILLLAACAPAGTVMPTATPDPQATAQAATLACRQCAIEHPQPEPSSTPPGGFEHPPTTPTATTAATGGFETRPYTLPSPGLSLTPASPQAVPTSAARPAPEKWQEWPVVSGLTARFVETYRKGLALGNDPRRFAKIGDCQCVNAAFFGIYDRPGQFELPKGWERLQETIDWFRGSFDRESQAVRGGFNVASVLSSFLADPQFCKAGETPLDCEFRLQRPSIVLISMETGFEGRTSAVYEKYMRRIIEYTLEKGAAPILATKADNFEGDHSINLVTARLAAEYDLPLWNFWKAVQPLPNKGMDPTRPDNFHISVEAWNVRSFTALQALDALWRGVR